MRVLGLVGWSGSGKTTLLVALLPLLRARGLRISTIKHAHHGFDMDRPGKDSFRHREAGAHEVLVVGGMRWALLHEVSEVAPSWTDLAGRLEPVDLVLVEGFKSHAYPKLEVHRPALGKPPLWPDQADIRAVATDRPEAIGVEGGRAPEVLPLNDPARVAAWIASVLPDLPLAPQR